MKKNLIIAAGCIAFGAVIGLFFNVFSSNSILLPFLKSATAKLEQERKMGSNAGKSASATLNYSSVPDKEAYFWSVMLGVTNSGEPRGLSRIGILCTYFNGSNAVDQAGTLVTGVEYGKTVYQKIGGPPAERNVTNVECRINYAHAIQ